MTYNQIGNHMDTLLLQRLSTKEMVYVTQVQILDEAA